MKISRVILSNYQQFGFIDLDFTYPTGHPKAGQPLDKVCLIGKNGTGKTTLLNILRYFLQRTSTGITFNSIMMKVMAGVGSTELPKDIRNTIAVIEISFNKNRFYNVFYKGQNFWLKSDDVKNIGQLQDKDFIIQHSLLTRDSNLLGADDFDFITNLSLYSQTTKNLLLYSPSESINNKMLQAAKVPQTQLNNALPFLTVFPYYHEISYDFLEQFWNLVIYQVKKRENDREEFENDEKNINKTKKQLVAEFDNQNPDFLKVLSEQWNIILEQAGLFFDYEKAKKPIQLNDNLEAYIKVKSNEEALSYSQLSSGIRHLIFRVGYLTSLFYKRKIESAVALFDEPENSLYPDLLYKIIDVYTSIAQNTQFFFATHSPIIAAQFAPYERFIFDFDEKHNVIYHRGVAPTGDDPNDILSDDFGLQNLMGKEGLKNWERFVELKFQIKSENDATQKDILMKEFMEIGNKYKF